MVGTSFVSTARRWSVGSSSSPSGRTRGCATAMRPRRRLSAAASGADAGQRRLCSAGEQPSHLCSCLCSACPRGIKGPPSSGGFEMNFWVTRAGFEPAISTLRGWRPGPLDERAKARPWRGWKRSGSIRELRAAPGCACCRLPVRVGSGRSRQPQEDARVPPQPQEDARVLFPAQLSCVTGATRRLRSPFRCAPSAARSPKARCLGQVNQES